MDASTQTVYDRIMALNRPSAPYQIIDGKAKGVDLIAEWKIVDAQWYEIFAKANLTKVFRIYLKFDPGKREVRTMDEELNVSWRACLVYQLKPVSLGDRKLPSRLAQAMPSQKISLRGKFTNTNLVQMN